MAQLPETSPPQISPKKPYGPAVWLATGLGFGFSPFAPGTVGGLWGLPLAWGIGHLPTLGPIPAAIVQLAVIVVIGLLSVPVCTAAARELGVKDPGAITLDELTSLTITFYLVPPNLLSNPMILAYGFLLHRIFDITKPPPARQLEHLPDGLGIMADDWAAGVYSCVCLHLVIWTGVFH